MGTIDGMDNLVVRDTDAGKATDKVDLILQKMIMCLLGNAAVAMETSMYSPDRTWYIVVWFWEMNKDLVQAMTGVLMR